jgi:hypothetical protein
MTINLTIPKGINGNAIRSVASEWTAQWFRRFVTDHLQNADYRNAITGPGISITGTEQLPGTIALASQASGVGTPTGASILTNFPGASATLAQTSAAVAKLIADLKAAGFYKV